MESRKSSSAILIVGKIFSNAAREVIQAATGLEIQISHTVQKVKNVQITEDIGGFVSFAGDYNGILVMNFQAEAALEIAQAYLRMMGMPEEEIPTHHHADDLRSNIGEIINQIIGKGRQMVQEKFNLVARSNTPAVVPVTIPIGMMLESSQLANNDCIRISFSTTSLRRFHMEISMESTEFIRLAD